MEGGMQRKIKFNLSKINYFESFLYGYVDIHQLKLKTITHLASYLRGRVRGGNLHIRIYWSVLYLMDTWGGNLPVLVLAVVLETPSNDMYMLTSSMVDIFMKTGHFVSHGKHGVRFNDISSIDDIWDVSTQLCRRHQLLSVFQYYQNNIVYLNWLQITIRFQNGTSSQLKPYCSHYFSVIPSSNQFNYFEGES